PKIHALPVLYKRCAEMDRELLSLMHICSALNPYAVAARYPKPLGSDEIDLKVAIENAQNVYDFCAGLWGQYLIVSEKKPML
ncbi:MAG: HEPN domain-containing protein, partial [Treponema sp.]|nr:HEPN domain-containing protein [Treponema sp.]